MAQVANITGYVLDHEGAPASNAKILIEPGPHIGRSSENGMFVFTRLERRTYNVSARRGVYFAWPVLVDANKHTEKVTLRLQLGTRCLFHVFGAGMPVSAAKILLEHGIETVTDAAGSACVVGLSPIRYRARLIADGWADEHFLLSLHPDPGGVVERTFNLVRGARFDGTVRDVRGATVPGAIVVARSVDDTQLAYETCSQSDGTWHLNMRAGTYRMYSIYSREPRWHYRSATSTIVSDGYSCNQDIDLYIKELNQGGVVRRVLDVSRRLLRWNWRGALGGVVVDEDMRPASGVEVRIAKYGPVRTDSRGRFELEGVMRGECDIVADWVGPWSSPRNSNVLRRVSAGDKNIRLVLPRGGVVVGRALIDGRPAPYLGLRLLAEHDAPQGSYPIGVRTDSGRFELQHIYPGKWRLALLSPGTMVAISDQFAIHQNEVVDVGEIVLSRGQRLNGYVRDQLGMPVSDARVVVGHMAAWAADRTLLERLFASHYEARTDSTGEYVLEGIDVPREPPGIRELVRATHPAWGASVARELPESDGRLDFVLLGVGRIEGWVACEA